jgi:hypothetical protein
MADLEADGSAILASPAATWWSGFIQGCRDRAPGRLTDIGDGRVSVACEGWPDHAKWLRNHLIREYGAPASALRIRRGKRKDDSEH